MRSSCRACPRLGRLPNGRALTGFAHEYKRRGATMLFAALEVATGLVHSGHYRRRRQREFLDFMNSSGSTPFPALPRNNCKPLTLV